MYCVAASGICDMHHQSYIDSSDIWTIWILTRPPEEKVAKEVGNFGSFGNANLELQ